MHACVYTYMFVWCVGVCMGGGGKTFRVFAAWHESKQGSTMELFEGVSHPHISLRSTVCSENSTYSCLIPHREYNVGYSDIVTLLNISFAGGTCCLQAEEYIHRIGRTGRAGRKGTATTLFTVADGRTAHWLVPLLVRCGHPPAPWLAAMEQQGHSTVSTNDQKLLQGLLGVVCWVLGYLSCLCCGVLAQDSLADVKAQAECSSHGPRRAYVLLMLTSVHVLLCSDNNLLIVCCALKHACSLLLVYRQTGAKAQAGGPRLMQ